MKGVFGTILIFALSLVFAQEPDLNNESDVYDYANELFDNQEFTKAFPYFERLIALKRTNVDYSFKYGTCLYFKGGQTERAKVFVGEATKSPSVDPRAYFYYGRILHSLYLFDAAIKEYTAFKSKDSKLAATFQTDLYISYSRNAKKMMANYADVFVLQKRNIDKESFFRYYDLGKIGGNIFVDDEIASKKDVKKGHRPILHTDFNSSVMVFASEGKESDGNLDIYVQTKTASGDWGSPSKLGSNVNTAQDENYPFYHEASGYLYFSSKAHGSIGGYDIFRIKFNKETAQAEGQVEHMEFAISSPDDDVLYIVDKEGRYGYFASNREGEKDKYHVYEVLIDRYQLTDIDVTGKYLGDGVTQNKKIDLVIENQITHDAINTSSNEEGVFNTTIGKAGKYEVFATTPSGNVHKFSVNLQPRPGSRTLYLEFEIKTEDGKELLIHRIKDGGEISGDMIANLYREKAKLEVNKDKIPDQDSPEQRALTGIDRRGETIEDITQELLTLLDGGAREKSKNQTENAIIVEARKTDSLYTLAQEQFEAAKTASNKKEKNQLLSEANKNLDLAEKAANRGMQAEENLSSKGGSPTLSSDEQQFLNSLKNSDEPAKVLLDNADLVKQIFEDKGSEKQILRTQQEELQTKLKKLDKNMNEVSDEISQNNKKIGQLSTELANTKKEKDKELLKKRIRNLEEQTVDLKDLQQTYNTKKRTLASELKAVEDALDFENRLSIGGYSSSPTNSSDLTQAKSSLSEEKVKEIKELDATIETFKTTSGLAELAKTEEAAKNVTQALYAQYAEVSDGENQGAVNAIQEQIQEDINALQKELENTSNPDEKQEIMKAIAAYEELAVKIKYEEQEKQPFGYNERAVELSDEADDLLAKENATYEELDEIENKLMELLDKTIAQEESTNESYGQTKEVLIAKIEEVQKKKETLPSVMDKAEELWPSYPEQLELADKIKDEQERTKEQIAVRQQLLTQVEEQLKVEEKAAKKEKNPITQARLMEGVQELKALQTTLSEEITELEGTQSITSSSTTEENPRGNDNGSTDNELAQAERIYTVKKNALIAVTAAQAILDQDNPSEEDIDEQLALLKEELREVKTEQAVTSDAELDNAEEALETMISALEQKEITSSPSISQETSEAPSSVMEASTRIEELETEMAALSKSNPKTGSEEAKEINALKKEQNNAKKVIVKNIAESSEEEETTQITELYGDNLAAQSDLIDQYESSNNLAEQKTIEKSLSKLQKEQVSLEKKITEKILEEEVVLNNELAQETIVTALDGTSSSTILGVAESINNQPEPIEDNGGTSTMMHAYAQKQAVAQQKAQLEIAAMTENISKEVSGGTPLAYGNDTELAKNEIEKTIQKLDKEITKRTEANSNDPNIVLLEKQKDQWVELKNNLSESKVTHIEPFNPDDVSPTTDEKIEVAEKVNLTGLKPLVEEEQQLQKELEEISEEKVQVQRQLASAMAAGESNAKELQESYITLVKEEQLKLKELKKTRIKQDFFYETRPENVQQAAKKMALQFQETEATIADNSAPTSPTRTNVNSESETESVSTSTETSNNVSSSDNSVAQTSTATNNKTSTNSSSSRTNNQSSRTIVKIDDGANKLIISQSKNRSNKIIKESASSVAAPGEVVYKVQVGAFRNPIPQELFKEFEPIYGQQATNGITRYFAGKFSQFSVADEAKKQIRKLGYSDAFVVAFQNGQRISISKAREQETGSVDNLSINTTNTDTDAAPSTTNQTQSTQDTQSSNSNNTTTQNNTNRTTSGESIVPSKDMKTQKGLTYTVQIGVFSRQVMEGDVIGITELNRDQVNNGFYRYSTGQFSSIEAAKERKQEVQSKIPDAFITAYYNGQRVSIAEAKKIEQGEVPSDEVATKIVYHREGVYYRVNLGKFDGNVPYGQIKDFIISHPEVEPVYELDANGYSNIYSKGFKNIEDAKKVLSDITMETDYPAEIVAFYMYDRIPVGLGQDIQNGKVDTVSIGYIYPKDQEYEDSFRNYSLSDFNKEGAYFRIFLGKFEDRIPVDYVLALSEIVQIDLYTEEDVYGLTHYYTGKLFSLKDAMYLKSELQKRGFEDVRVAGYYTYNEIRLDVVQSILSN